MSPARNKQRIGELLIGKGHLTEAQLEQVLAQQRKAGGKVGEICLQMGFITEDQMVDVLASQLGVPRVQLSSYLIEPEVLKLVPQSAARRHRVIPLFRIEDTLTVAMADPLNVYAIDEIQQCSGLELDPTITTPSEIEEALKQHYGVGGSFQDVIAELARERPETSGDETRSLEALAQDAPVIKLVNVLLAQAVSESASDIHLEPTPREPRVRLRVDGILHEIPAFPAHSHAAVVSRIKIMANLDIAEKRVPQDGRLQLSIGRREVDMRVSSYPTAFGEKIVIRVLDKARMQIDLEQLGLEPDTRDVLESVIRRPTGIVLLTGPTGSGKTTTLYGALQRISSLEKNVMTIEDPIEYYLDVVNQSQVNPKAGLTFASGLRSILRQDPDVIMVGEIRDQDTAEIAIRASMTGHLVFSTLHTNDAAGAITRLVDIGLEPYLPASTVTAVLAQRLVRVVCDECAVSDRPGPEMLARLGQDHGVQLDGLRRGKGCASCHGTGFHGRTGLFELLEMNGTLQDLVSQKTSAAVLRKAAVAQGMRTLRQDGLLKASRGLTSLEEVLKVT
jgi:type IV pilus assembly protein PilB